MKTDATTYIQFLRAYRELEQSSVLREMDLLERRIMDLLAEHWHQDQAVRLVDVMMLHQDIASPTTVYRRVKNLLQKKLIAQVTGQSGDRRNKQIVPTQAAREYFERLGRCVAYGAAQAHEAGSLKNEAPGSISINPEASHGHQV